MIWCDGAWENWSDGEWKLKADDEVMAAVSSAKEKLACSRKSSEGKGKGKTFTE